MKAIFSSLIAVAFAFNLTAFANPTTESHPEGATPTENADMTTTTTTKTETTKGEKWAKKGKANKAETKKTKKQKVETTTQE